MPMQITLDLPPDVEKRLLCEVRNIDVEVKNAYVLELFRRGLLSHYELAQILGLDRVATDAYLKQHGVFEGSLTLADLEMDHRTLADLAECRG
jgi:hypothetical protein